MPPSVTSEEEDLYNLSDEELDKLARAANKDVDVEEIDDTENVNVDEEMEQPIEDSKDTNQDDENDQVDDSEEIDSEVPNDGQTEEDTTKENTTTETNNQTFKVKANGMEFDFSLDELQALAPKAMDYTKKMQEIAPYRKTVAAMKEYGISQEDINLLIDIKKGDKEAIASMLKSSGVDALDLDVDNHKYVPKDYSVDDSTLKIRDIVSRISVEPEYKVTQNIVDNQWDSASRARMRQEPEMIEGLHNDIKSGLFDKVYPEAMKLKAYDGGNRSDLEYYMAAGQMLMQKEPQVPTVNPQIQQEQVRKQGQQTVKSNADKRKAASLPKSKAGNKDIIDYLDDTDESYDQWYKSVMSKI